MPLHSNQLINFLLAERALQEDEQGKSYLRRWAWVEELTVVLVVVLLVVADWRLALPLLYCFYVISPLLSLSCLLFFSLSPRVLSIYRKKTEQVCFLLVRLQSRNGWSAIDAFKMVFVFCCCSNGGRRKMNSVIQNDTVLVFLFFYIWNDVVLDKTRRFI